MPFWQNASHGLFLRINPRKFKGLFTQYLSCAIFGLHFFCQNLTQLLPMVVLLDHCFLTVHLPFLIPVILFFWVVSFCFSFFLFFFVFLSLFFLSLFVFLSFWLAFFCSFCFSCFLSFSRCLSLFSFFCSPSLKLFVLVPTVVFAESAGCRLTLMQTFWSAGCGNAVLWRRVWRVFLLAGRLMASMATLTTPSKPSSRLVQF